MVYNIKFPLKITLCATTPTHAKQEVGNEISSCGVRNYNGLNLLTIAGFRLKYLIDYLRS